MLRSRGLGLAIAQHFGDGEWHETEEVVAKCGHLIPPEIAIRRALYNHPWYQTGQTIPNMDLTHHLELGKRYIVRSVLRSSGAIPGGPGTRQKWSRFRIPKKTRARMGRTEHYTARLTTQQAVDILRAWNTGPQTSHRQYELAQTYQVSKTAIYNLIIGRTWVHLNRDELEPRYVDPASAF